VKTAFADEREARPKLAAWRKSLQQQPAAAQFLLGPGIAGTTPSASHRATHAVFDVVQKSAQAAGFPIETASDRCAGGPPL